MDSRCSEQLGRLNKSPRNRFIRIIHYFICSRTPVNLIVGSHAGRIVEESRKILNGKVKKGQQPDLWDGIAANRIVKILVESFQ